jgi:CHAT domain-containing protein
LRVFVPLELARVTQAHQTGAQYLNEDFTLDTLRRESRNGSRILHLATHASFKSGQADRAYIQLWDGPLHINDLRQLKWYEDPQIELLVLSACETAFDDYEAELGFAGLAVQAGAKSVLASLWQVSDLGTLALMDQFYAQLHDPNVTIKAEALRQAQIALLRGEFTVQNGFVGDVPLPPELAQKNPDLTHPYHWSSFLLVGSPW